MSNLTQTGKNFLLENTVSLQTGVKDQLLTKNNTSVNTKLKKLSAALEERHDELLIIQKHNPHTIRQLVGTKYGKIKKRSLTLPFWLLFKNGKII